ncbi:pre-mRNA-processing factor 39 [Lineolata rhizophorae]|uniref:Pre-mRNA-processing factor 39 n=1 Tax=Lineolata rhizophorae TaxID=578093 RepID=A0A6A6NYJ9_9PEZI|nr:pre-mRNA-processing factor 39 [Lineolata rhizophorae]
MVQFTLGGLEDQPELRDLADQVSRAPDEMELWEKLVAHAESLEGGLNRNSSPQAITAVREIYDAFLAKFPLFYGYWKKYADLEFSIAGTEAAEMVYERGVASVPTGVELWANYCGFKVDTTHDTDVIRELFERGVGSVGLDFMSHTFWDKYLEFEERMEATDRIFAVLDRVVHIPLHQSTRYFERHQQLAHSRPTDELAPSEILSHFKEEIGRETSNKVLTDLEVERELRTKISQFHAEIYARTQLETTKRWQFEQSISRPYFHVLPLDENELVNWRKYLDFEEVEGDYRRTVYLYERCLTTAALYEEFWLRYARWMMAQAGKEEEVRIIYQRASCVYVPISRLSARHNYALFEEMCGRVDVSKAIYEAILLSTPGSVETVVALAEVERRHGGLDAAITVLKAYIDTDNPAYTIYVKGALVAEWAKLLWKIKGSPEEARQVFQKNAQYYLDVRRFWVNYLEFELEQPTSEETETAHYQRIKQVHNQATQNARLPPLVVKDMTHRFMMYLLERGGPGAAKEYMELDKEANGPFSARTGAKAKLAEDGNEATTMRRMILENGHPGVEVNEAAVRRGESPYTKYYQQQGENSVGNNGQPTPLRYP